MSNRIRILSDIHWGHRASLVKDPAMLAPLAEGADTLIFNGDTVETKYSDSPEHNFNKLPTFEAFQAEVAGWGVEARYITGNHDPDATSVHWLSIARGEVFVTHGDGLFDSIAPWSCQAPVLAASLRDELRGLPASQIDAYLGAVKRAIIQAHRAVPEFDPTVWGKLQMLLRQCWPPSKPFKILNTWRIAAQEAVAFAERFALAPKHIVVGHTHLPGVESVRGIDVVNTGSFFFWPGAYCVDLCGKELVVRQIKKSADAFSIGPAIARRVLQNAATIDAPQAKRPAPLKSMSAR